MNKLLILFHIYNPIWVGIPESPAEGRWGELIPSPPPYETKQGLLCLFYCFFAPQLKCVFGLSCKKIKTHILHQANKIILINILIFTYMSISTIPQLIKAFQAGFLERLVMGCICLLKR
jgi:hypothetical protein